MEKFTNEKSRIVIYHGNCADGFTAAWAAWRKFGNEDTEYVAAFHGAPLVQNVCGREVIFLDFAFPRENMLAIERVAKSLLVLDHHKTAANDLKDCAFAKFDMERSGAGIAWDTFHDGYDRPWIVDYVEDRDLWRFHLSNSKLVNAWISAQRVGNFLEWDEIEFHGVLKAMDKGYGVLAYIDTYVREMAEHARVIEFDGHRVPVVNAPFSSISELLGSLAEKAPFALGWFQRGDGMYQYSLRSRGPDGIDVSEIAKRHGGGGHKNAAGFQSKTMLAL